MGACTEVVIGGTSAHMHRFCKQPTSCFQNNYFFHILKTKKRKSKSYSDKGKKGKREKEKRKGKNMDYVYRYIHLQPIPFCQKEDMFALYL